MSIVEACRELGISEDHAKVLIKEGRMPGLLPRIYFRWRVSRAGLEEYLNSYVRILPDGTAVTAPPIDDTTPPAGWTEAGWLHYRERIGPYARAIALDFSQEEIDRYCRFVEQATVGS